MEINIGYTDDNLNNKMEINIVNHIKNQTFNMLYESSNKEKNNITENANISFNNNSKDIQIFITNITNLKEDIQIEKLTTDNTIMLNDYAPENLKILVEAIKDRINQLYGVQIEKIKTQFQLYLVICKCAIIVDFATFLISDCINIFATK